MELSNVSIKELVEELATREAVEKILINPYQGYKIIIENNENSDTEPAVLLRIWD